LVHRIHGLAEKLELETGATESIDPTIRFIKHPSGLEGVLDCVR